MLKVVRFYVVCEDGTEYSSKNFNVDYTMPDQLLTVLKDIYSIVATYKKVVDIYINEPVYDINGYVKEEIPIVSYFELLKHPWAVTYSIENMFKSANFLNVINACMYEPLRVMQSGIIREEHSIVPNPTSVHVYPNIVAANWITLNYGTVIVDYSIQDIKELEKILKEKK